MDKRAAVPGPVQGRPWPHGTLLWTCQPDERAALLALGTRRHFSPGETVIHEGDTTTEVTLLIDGCTKVLGDTADGQRVLLAIRVAGDLVGELAALDDRPRSATVTAVTPVTGRVIAQRAFLRLLDERPELARLVHRSVADKLRMATRHRVDVGRTAPVLRLARLLAQLAAAHGRPTSRGVLIDVPISQTELAALVGTSEPSVQRALKHLREGGAVHTGYRQLTVVDRDLMLSLAESYRVNQLATATVGGPR